jgi:hypothetical protein
LRFAAFPAKLCPNGAWGATQDDLAIGTAVTALAELQALLAALADRLGLDPDTCRPPLKPEGGAFHLTPRGDRFDLSVAEQGRIAVRDAGLGLDDAAYEVVFVAALASAEAEERTLRQGVACRWNWMGAHISLMERARPEWGEKTRAHYRRILTGQPLSESEIAAIRPGLLRPEKDM